MAAHLTVAEARFLQWLAVWDRKHGWEHLGAKSAAHWLNYKIGLAIGAGRENLHINVDVAAPVDHLTHQDTNPTENVSAETSTIGNQRARISANTAQRLACDCNINLIVTGTNGDPIAVGTPTRTINRKLRRALEHRDNNCCQFPGCTTTRRLHAHHIHHWAHGGPTNLANLTLLCSFHHHAVHEGGFTITPTVTPAGVDLTFNDPQGNPIEVGRLRGNVIDFHWLNTATTHRDSLKPTNYRQLRNLSYVNSIITAHTRVNQRNAELVA